MTGESTERSTYANRDNRCSHPIKLICLSLFGLAAIAAPSSNAQEASSKLVREVRPDLNSIAQLRGNLKAFLKNSKREHAPEVQHAAILNLCQLHWRVVTDPRFYSSDSLQGIRATSATRLSTMSKEIATAEKRAARFRSDSPRRAQADQNAGRAGQDSGRVVDRPGSQTGALDLSPTNGTTDAAIAYGYDIVNHINGSFAGGAGQLDQYLGNFGPESDFGPELVALIENTINPNYWRVKGGPGSLYYYRPGLALVVTASQEMQDRVHSLLMRLK